MATKRVRDTDLTWRQVDDEIVILDLASSTYFSLNGTAALLWPQLADGAEPAALADFLVAQFSIDRDQAEADIAAFLDHCTSLDLVR